MNKIEINVKNGDGSIIGKLDIGNAEINTVFQLVDIREPEKKSGDHTLQFTIPGTKINNTIFQHIYENGFSSFSYNPNKRLMAQILVDGNQYFIGYLQMNVASKIDNKLIEYEVTIYGAFVSFFSDMADKTLRDIIDLSDYNHKYTEPVIIESWKTNIYQYGKKKTFQLGEGYVYPMEYRGQDEIQFVNMELFRPAIYVKTIFDRLLQKYGITYNSTFLNSEYFRRLIMPYSGDKNMGLTQEQIDNIDTLANAPSPPNRPLLGTITSKADRTYKDFRQIIFPNDTILPAKDLGGNYNPTTGIMTIPKNGNYNLVSVVRLQLEYTGDKKDGTNISPMRLRGGMMTGKLRIVDVNTKKDLKSTDFTFTTKGFGGGWLTPYVYSDDIDVTVSYTGPLTKGSQYKIVLDVSVPKSKFSYQTISGITPAYPLDGPAVETNVNIVLVSTPLGLPTNPADAPRFELALIDTNVTEGDTLDMNYFIPDMKAVDFIKEINKLFNLYWKPIGDRKFIIEPRDTFYSTKTNILDWTYQVDNAKSMKIEPIYDLNYKEYNFSYTYDNDYYNKDYTDSYNETYGSKTVTVDNDFVVEKIDIKSSFSPTVTVHHLNSKRALPAMVTSDGKTMNYYKAKQRILFYGGLVDPKFVPGTQGLQFNTSFTKWYFKSPYSNIVVDYNLIEYPYAGHFDNPSNPRWDLNWGMTKKYYFSWNSVCDNGLYNMFWRNYTEEMLDKNNHLLTAQIILSSSDMNNFDIRNIIQVNHVYYRINKLTHNPLTDEAEVELIKIKAFTPVSNSIVYATLGSSADGTNTPTPTNIGGVPVPKPVTTTPGGFPWTPRPNPPYIDIPNVPYWDQQSPFAGDEYNPSININSWSTRSAVRWYETTGEQPPINVFNPTANYDVNNNIFSPQSTRDIMGNNNYVDPSSSRVRVSGSNNRVMSNTTNVTIQGNNNEVGPGLTNVSIVGDNQTVNESNIAILNGVIIKDGATRKNTRLIKSTVDKVGTKTSGLRRGGKNSVTSCIVVRGGQDTSL